MDKGDLMVKAITQALMDLEQAIRLLESKTVPQTPLPRPRLFVIAKDAQQQEACVWPGIDDKGTLCWHSIVLIPAADLGKPIAEMSIKHAYPLDHGYGVTRDRLVELSRSQPARVWNIVRALQAAAAWCHKRYRGRLRHAEELLRQQAKAMDDIEAFVAMVEMSK